MSNALRKDSFRSSDRKKGRLRLVGSESSEEDEVETRAVEVASRHEPVKPPKTQAEIEDFYVANIKLIHRLLQSYRGLDEYDDLFQEASVGFIKGLKAYDAGRGVKLTTFAYECARNEVKMYLRKIAAKSRTAIVVPLEYYNGEDEPSENDSILNRDLSEVDTLSPLSKSLEELVCQHDLYEKAMAIVDQMTFEQQTVIKRYLQGVPQSEVAKELNSSQSNISKTLKNSICELVLKLKNLHIIE